MSDPNRQISGPGQQRPEGGFESFMAILGVVAVLGVGMETLDNISTYNPYNPPKISNSDPFSWVAVPLTEVYETFVAGQP